jgi:hypothetical protein
MRVWIAAVALVAIAGCANGGERLTGPSPVTAVTPTVPANCTVPAAPGHLSADVTGASVNLSWSAVDDASDYVVLVGWTPVSSESVLTNTSEAQHWIESVAAGTHFARVLAHNWCGTSASSEPIAFTVQ